MFNCQIRCDWLKTQNRSCAELKHLVKRKRAQQLAASQLQRRKALRKLWKAAEIGGPQLGKEAQERTQC